MSPAAASVRIARSMSLMIEGWMPSVGSSRITWRAPDRQLLLLPAGEVAAAPREHRLEHREHVEDRRRDALGSHQQVFFYAQARKDLAPLRHIAKTGARALIGPRAGEALVLEKNFSAPRGKQAHQRFEQRSLADAVAAQQGGDLPGRHLEAHVAQDVAAAVVLVESLNDQGTPRSRAD